ncbi:MAG: VWA domain-containing protein [Alcanivoracaceae bacterium]|nr:VWA domain-containing protein [Alcanivoracaceae bacterium]
MKQYKKLAVVAACMILSACGVDNDTEGLVFASPQIDVSGLDVAEQMEVTLGAETLTVTANGVSTFATTVNLDSGYTLTVTQSPVGKTCRFSNGLTQITASGAVQVVFCGSGINTAIPLGDSPFQMRAWTAAATQPSLISLTVGIVDLNGNARTGATVDDFRFFNSDDNEIFSTTEAPIHVEAIPLTNLTLRTALVLDISRSFTALDIDVIKQAAQVAVDGMQPFQLVSIFVFDGSVTQLTGYTDDQVALTAAIDAIPRDPFLRDSSTNLYGAVLAAGQSWQDFVLIDTADIGFAILITDGTHNTTAQTYSDIEDDVEGRQFFAVGIGASVDVTALREITDDLTGSKGNVIQVSDTSGLAGAFAQITQRQVALASGLHVVYYLAPERDTGGSDERSFTVQVRDNSSCLALVDEAFCAYMVIYDTAGFTGNNGLIIIPNGALATPGTDVDFTVPDWFPCSDAVPNLDWTLNVLQGSATGAVLDADSYRVTLGAVAPIEFELLAQDLSSPGCSGTINVLIP